MTQEFIPRINNAKPFLASKEYIPEYDDFVRKLAKLHISEVQVASFFGVSATIFRRWRKKHPTFNAAYWEGCALADAEVANALHTRALGYTATDTVTIKQLVKKSNGDTEQRITETTTVKHYPPDTTAGIFWLQTRQQEAWRLGPADKPGVQVLVGGPSQQALSQPLPPDPIDATRAYQELMK